MSDGHYCLVRDLGPVKGGKGLKHHEVVVDFSLRGIRDLAKRLWLERVRRTTTDAAADVAPPHAQL